MGKSWKSAGKTENAQKKGMLFTKVAREISVASKAGGPDTSLNPRLRLAVDAAKKISCPNDTIERAIKKGAGLLDDGKIIEEITYEGYGPHGVGVIVECQTDNKHRTAPEIRSVFKKYDGNLGETNSVGWMFARVGAVDASKTGKFDIDEEAIEAGADDFSNNEDGTFEFFTSVENLDLLTKALASRGWDITSSSLSYRATTITEISELQRKDVEKFLSILDDMDDTHKIFATI